VQPKVLLLDEPFGALDALTKLKLHEELVRLWQMDHASETVLMVTHDISEAISMADRVIVLSARPGRVKANYKIQFEKGRGSVLEVPSLPEYSEYFRTIWDQLEVSGVSF